MCDETNSSENCADCKSSIYCCIELQTAWKTWAAKGQNLSECFHEKLSWGIFTFFFIKPSRELKGS